MRPTRARAPRGPRRDADDREIESQMTRGRAQQTGRQQNGDRAARAAGEGPRHATTATCERRRPAPPPPPCSSDSRDLRPLCDATWPKPMFLTSALTERYKPQNTHRKSEIGKTSDPRPTPELETSASAAAQNPPFCARCDLRPKPQSTKSQKPTTTKTARAQRDSNPQPTICVYSSAPPATAPLHAPPATAPSMFVLAGQNRKWALSVLFCI